MTNSPARPILIAGALLGLFVKVAIPQVCPGHTLSITYSWPPSSTVRILNSGVPSTAVNTVISNWNAMNQAYECFGPTFTTSPVSGAQVNLFYVPLPPDPVTGRLTRGLTNLPGAILLLGRIVQVDVSINNAVTATAAIIEILAHELGHTQALADCARCGLHSTVMETEDPVASIDSLIGLPGPTVCDIQKVKFIVPDYGCPTPAPSPTPRPPAGCYSWITFCQQFANDPRCDEEPPDGRVCIASPIVVDVLGNGFDLTGLGGGVQFNLNADGAAEQISWTSPGSDDAWLALDRNSNGTIDDGTELFGNFTPQPEPPAGIEKNGFLALAEYDKPGKGGNSDGKINKQDTVFSSLWLWQDTNHNGISEPTELHDLRDLGLKSIDLNYRMSRRSDDYGNHFLYRSKVKDTHDSQLGRWAWDVFLVTSP